MCYSDYLISFPIIFSNKTFKKDLCVYPLQKKNKVQPIFGEELQNAVRYTLEKKGMQTESLCGVQKARRMQ